MYLCRSCGHLHISGIVIFSVAVGVAVSVGGEKSKAIYDVFVAINSVIFCIMTAITW